MSGLATTKSRYGVVPASAPTIWRWVRNDQFPKPFRLNGMTVWDAEAVDDFIRARIEEGAA